MSEIAQHLIILAFVLAATAWLARRAWLSLHGRKVDGCSCASKACGSRITKDIATQRHRTPSR